MFTITSNYGIRTRPNTNKTEFTSGVDIVPQTKDKSVPALTGGKIVNIGLQGNGNPGLKNPAKFKELGWYIDVLTDDGKYLRYGHLDPIKNRKNLIGKQINPGETLAFFGKGSGSGTGPHVKVYLSETPDFSKKLNPTDLLNRSKEQLQTGLPQSKQPKGLKPSTSVSEAQDKNLAQKTKQNTKLLANSFKSLDSLTSSNNNVIQEQLNLVNQTNSINQQKMINSLQAEEKKRNYEDKELALQQNYLAAKQNNPLNSFNLISNALSGLDSPIPKANRSVPQMNMNGFKPNNRYFQGFQKPDTQVLYS